jgi:hypothetical protein
VARVKAGNMVNEARTWAETMLHDARARAETLERQSQGKAQVARAGCNAQAHRYLRCTQPGEMPLGEEHRRTASIRAGAPHSDNSLYADQLQMLDESHPTPQ